jgi:hypothetical protein
LAVRDITGVTTTKIWLVLLALLSVTLILTAVQNRGLGVRASPLLPSKSST